MRTSTLGCHNVSGMSQPPNFVRLSKFEALNQFLDDGKTMVYLDSRADGVDVPESLRDNPNLRLNLSRRFPRPLLITQDGVDAVLTFGGEPYRCVIPYAAIFGIFNHVTHKELLWPDDIPADLLEPQGPTPPQARPNGRKKPGTVRGRPHLAVVPDPGPPEETQDGQEAVPGPPQEPPPTDPPPPKKGHLRVVK